MNRFHVFQIYLPFLFIINVGCTFLLDSQTKRNVDRGKLTTDCEMMTPVLVPSGTKFYVTFRCSPCEKKLKIDEVYWLKRRREGDGRNDEVLHVDGKHIHWVSPKYLLMRITDLRLEDTGIYTCMKGNAVQGTYDLIVSPELIVQNVLVFTSLGERPMGANEKENSLMFTGWRDWSDCNRCRELGERQRQGWCLTNLYKEQLPSGKYVKCQYAAKYDKKLSNEEKKKYAGEMNYLEYEECYLETCPKNDQDEENTEFIIGSQLTEMNINTLAISIPDSRFTISKQIGERVLIVCPDTRKDYSLLSWRKGAMAISNTATRRLRQLNHIEVDWASNLHIRDLTTEDSGLYSCWQNYILKATFRLHVVAKPNRSLTVDTNRTIVYVTSGMLLAILLCIIIGIIVGVIKKKQNIKQKERADYYTQKEEGEDYTQKEERDYYTQKEETEDYTLREETEDYTLKEETEDYDSRHSDLE